LGGFPSLLSFGPSILGFLFSPTTLPSGHDRTSYFLDPSPSSSSLASSTTFTSSSKLTGRPGSILRHIRRTFNRITSYPPVPSRFIFPALRITSYPPIPSRFIFPALRIASIISASPAYTCGRTAPTKELRKPSPPSSPGSRTRRVASFTDLVRLEDASPSPRHAPP
jgi:hypothetical protein